MNAASSFFQAGEAFPLGCDLYFAWANRTNFRYVDGFDPAESDAESPLQLLIECKGKLRSLLMESAKGQLSSPFEAAFSSHHLFDVDAPPPADPVSVFSVSALKKLVLFWLHSHKADLIRLELSAARVAPKIPKDAGLEIFRPLKAPEKISNHKVVMAVIDDGLPFLHEHFRKGTNKSETRVRYFWDQTPEKTEYPVKNRRLKVSGANPQSTKSWKPVYRFGYGRELTDVEINALIAVGFKEADHYNKTLDYARCLPKHTHGSHVCDLATGGDESADIPLIMVQLPGPVVQDTSGGGTAKHVADAILYILDRVADDAAVVINLSFGTNAGPHDGSTLIERVMDAISLEQQKKRGFLIVLPAGNAYNSQGHGQLKLKRDSPQNLIWNVRFDDPTESFCELWWPREQWSFLKVCVIDPSGNRAEWNHSKPEVFNPEHGETVSAVLGTSASSAANEKSHALIALAPTLISEKSPRAQPGLWRIELTNIGDTEFSVDAWIQRDDSPMNTLSTARQSFFMSTRGTLSANDEDVPEDSVKRMGTGNSLAHGSETVVVGGVVKSDGALALYSAAATSVGAWPDALAVCEESAASSGVMAAGTRSGDSFRMNGTSVAAPQVSRLIAKSWANGGVQKNKSAVLAALFGSSRQLKPPSNICSARTGAGRKLP